MKSILNENNLIFDRYVSKRVLREAVSDRVLVFFSQASEEGRGVSIEFGTIVAGDPEDVYDVFDEAVSIATPPSTGHGQYLADVHVLRFNGEKYLYYVGSVGDWGETDELLSLVDSDSKNRAFWEEYQKALAEITNPVTDDYTDDYWIVEDDDAMSIVGVRIDLYQDFILPVDEFCSKFGIDVSKSIVYR